MMKTIHTPAYLRLLGVLRARRLELGLGQRQVAAKLKVPVTWTSKIEQGERRLDALELYRLSRLYEIRWADLEPLLRERP